MIYFDGMFHPARKTRRKGRSPSPPDQATPDDYYKVFAAVFSPRAVQRISRKSAFVQRHRKLESVALLHPLALEAGPPF
jgi:hypothetical protein